MVPLMAFLREPIPEYGVPLPVAPGIARIVAPNPSVMTYHGTNTYLLDRGRSTDVLDPGPDDSGHLRAILQNAPSRIRRIFVTHSHHDHLGATGDLAAKTGAQVYAFHTPTEVGFAPDVGLRDGDTVEGMLAVHTPGHAADHLCFATPSGILFSADHVMGWSSSVVSPPLGDMAAYFSSLRRLIARDDRLYLPGHGPPVINPRSHVKDLLERRLQREEEIVAALRVEPLRPRDLAEKLYDKRIEMLRRAAERNVLAHLLKLQRENRVTCEADFWSVKEPAPL